MRTVHWCDLVQVRPLYRHLLPPCQAPSLSFLGLPWKVVPFPLMELQASVDYASISLSISSLLVIYVVSVG